jgi:lysophospholipid acyltransferase (LPLAT)-like uncharacterized protein
VKTIDSDNENGTPKPKLDSVSFCIWAIASILGKTWRPRAEGFSPGRPYTDLGHGNIYVLWHSSLLTLAYLFRTSHPTVLVSNSKDGIRAAAVAAQWNFEIAFGSSSHDGFSAFRKCLKAINDSKNAVITPDGPRGPKETVKAGAAYLAKLTNAPVIPLSAIPDNYWRLKSWDRLIIPKPFSKITIHAGKTVFPDTYGKDESEIERLRLKIEENLHAITLA